MREQTEALIAWDKAFEPRKWAGELPFMDFPEDWEVKVIPPFGGAVVRFVVRRNDARVSVYFDAFAQLGATNRPYWEIHPAYGETADGYDLGGDCYRVVGFQDEAVDELFDWIERSLQHQEQTDE